MCIVILNQKAGHGTAGQSGLGNGKVPDDKLRTVLWQWAEEPFTPEEIVLLEKAQLSLVGELGQLLAPLLTVQEIQETNRRVAELLSSGTFPLPNPDWPAVPWPAF